MEKEKRSIAKMIIIGLLVFIIVYGFQVASGKLGWAVADLFNLETVDPADLFARLSIHHFILMLVTLVVILIIGKLAHIDFGFHLGEKKVGMRFFLIFSGAIALIAVGYHLLMYLIGQPIVYDYPLTWSNILGSLGFQLLLSGPAEEVLYRALPVTLLVLAFGRKIYLSENITLEVVLASLLFTAAHISWTLSPFSISELNIFGLVYAFAMGILNGLVYQKSRSILYPILMHSISNVLMVGTGYLFAFLF